MATKATATPVVASPASSDQLLVALLNSRAKGSTSDRVAAIISDTMSSTVNGSVEVMSRSFGGVPTVWSAGIVSGKLDGLGYSRAMMERAALRNGFTVEQVAALINS